MDNAIISIDAEQPEAPDSWLGALDVRDESGEIDKAWVPSGLLGGMEMAFTDGGEIVVTGRRIDGFGPGVVFVEYGDAGSGMEPHPTLNPDGGGGPPPPADCEAITVTADLGDRGFTEEEKAVMDELTAVANDLLQKIGALPAAAAFTYPDGTSVTAGELYNLLRLADFTAIATGTAPSNDAGTGLSAGAADRNGGNPIFSMEIDDLMMLQGSGYGMIIYILHELSHVTIAGDQRNGGMYAPGSDGGATVTAAEWYSNEAWAYTLAREIAREAGKPLPVSWLPPHDIGYSPTTPQYTEPTDPNAQTAAEAYVPCGF